MLLARQGGDLGKTGKIRCQILALIESLESEKTNLPIRPSFVGLALHGSCHLVIKRLIQDEFISFREEIANGS